MLEAGTRGASGSISTSISPVVRSRTTTEICVDPSPAAASTDWQSDWGPAVSGVVSRADAASSRMRTGAVRRTGRRSRRRAGRQAWGGVIVAMRMKGLAGVRG